MSWNYRIMAHKYNAKEVYFEMHEVYYNKKGIPDGYSENAVSIGGDSKKDIKWTLKKMRGALRKPILWTGDKFPKRYKP